MHKHQNLTANRTPPSQGTHGAHKMCVYWTTWWLWRGDCTRSHPELGRENPQRLWYCVSRRGRGGRRQVFQYTHSTLALNQPTNDQQTNRPTPRLQTRGGAARQLL